MKQRMGVCDYGHSSVARQTESSQTASGGKCLLAELPIRQHRLQLARAAVEVIAGLPLRREVQRVSQPGKFSLRTGDLTARRRCA